MMQARRTGCPARHICQKHAEDSTPAAHCTQPYEKVEQNTHRDSCMTAEEAGEYGIVDHVLHVLTDGRVPNPLKEQ
jgi:ATP-dependent protease ClpP protease subunit